MSMILTYRFQNNNEEKLTVIIEPWAEEFDVPPKSILGLSIAYDRPGLIDTEINPKYFVIWLWAGCCVQVSLDGKDLPTGSLTIPAFG